MRKHGKLGSGLELSLSAFLFTRPHLADGSMVNFQVIRYLFQQIPMSMVDILIPLRPRLLLFKYLFEAWLPEMPLRTRYFWVLHTGRVPGGNFLFAPGLP